MALTFALQLARAFAFADHMKRDSSPRAVTAFGAHVSANAKSAEKIVTMKAANVGRALVMVSRDAHDKKRKNDVSACFGKHCEDTLQY
jgi:hypothetical protein